MHGDPDDEELLDVLDEYNTEGMNMEDLKLWMQTAPADQRLIHDTKLSVSSGVKALYDTEGISEEDLELWHEFAPPDQILEARLDSEMEIDDMDSVPTSDIPKLDLGPLQKALHPEVRRGRLRYKPQKLKPSN